MGIYLPDEPARSVALVLAVSHTGRCKRHTHSPLGTGKGNIEQTPLLLDIGRRSHHPSGREEILLHSGNIYIRKLQALGRVDRHKRHLVGTVVVLVFSIGIAQQGGRFQEIRQGDTYGRNCLLIRIHIRQDIFHPLLLERLHRVKQLVQIGSARHSLDGSIRLIKGVKP